MQGLLVFKLENTLGDCTNGGISSDHNEFVLTGEDVVGVSNPTDKAPELKLVYRHSLNYYHAEPNFPPHGIGWMFGGNFIYSSDSRFPNKYPIPIHDRQETQAQYDILST